MTRQRKIFVGFLVAGLLVGHAIDGLLGQEHWPFSNYPMYAKVLPTDRLESYRLYGIAVDGHEFYFERPAFLKPLGPKKVNKTLIRLARNGDHAGLSQALRDCAIRYPGVGLKGLRLYHLQWAIDPWARNKKEPVRTLVHEELL